MSAIRTFLAKFIPALRQPAPTDPTTTVARVPSGLRPGDPNPAAGDKEVARKLRDAGADVEAYDPEKDAP